MDENKEHTKIVQKKYVENMTENKISRVIEWDNCGKCGESYEHHTTSCRG